MPLKGTGPAMMRSSAHESIAQLLCTRTVDEHPTSARTTLTCCADCAEDDRGYREIQIRELIDDDRVVAPELEQALAQSAGHFLSNLPSDCC